MRGFTFVIFYTAIISLLGACAGRHEAGADGQLSHHKILVGERERSYLLYAPKSSDPRFLLRPLVLVFHGGGGTAKGIVKEVGESLHSLADRDGFFVAYPDAINKMWDFGAGEVSEALEVRIDDRRFFDELIDELLDTRPIDARRIFATGISRGGQASYFVACAFPGRIRAIAPVAMPMPVFQLDACNDAPATGVAVLNGTADPLVPYEGGQVTVGRRERGEVMSTDDTVAFWRARNRCSAEATDEQVIDPRRDRMRVRRTSWEQCVHAPVVLYRIEGGGHTWPSGRQYLPRFVIGPVNRDIDGAEEIWSFFSRFH